MSDSNRLGKYEKRRKNTKTISLLLILGGILIIILLAIFLFGGNDEEAEKGEPSNQSTSESNSDASNNKAADDETNDDTASDDTTESSSEDTTSSSESDDPTKNDDSSENDDQSTKDDNTGNDDVEKEPVEVTDDPNVKEAYTADWEPIGTEQEGPHAKKFAEGTQDRTEMEKALHVATGIQEGDMITWFVENGGGQDVIGTVSNKAEEKTYRVFLTWVENEGYKPTKVEILKENDKK